MARRSIHTRRVPYHKSYCDIQLLQMIIYFFNFLFYVSCVVFIGLAMWSYVAKYSTIGLLSYSNRYLQSIILCFVIGLIMFVVASSGCWAILKRKQFLLLLYCILVLLTLLMEFTLCIMTYVYIEQLENNLGTTLLMSVIRDHSEHNDISRALKHLHRQGHCCGSQSFEDWRDSVWWQKVNSASELKQRSFDLAVPDFCCRSERPNCGRRDHPSNIYYNGCLSYLMKVVKEHLLIICGASFALALVQIFGIGFGICLYIKWRDFLEFRPVSTNSRQRDDATVMYSL